MKKLKIWNGRGWGNQRYDKEHKLIPDPTGKEYCEHFYVCANSVAHAIRLINEVAGRNVANYREANEYWNKGCWGNAMDGVQQEIGVWTTQEYNDKPKRII
jgi:hypothetical protein